MDVLYIGNVELLREEKTAFMAAGDISSDEVLRCYDWATEMRDSGHCVVSGFSSKLERDVLHFLLKGQQPIIMVLARRMYKQLPAAWQQAVDNGRLLIIITSNSVRQSRYTAQVRNRYVAELCDKIYFAGITPTSTLFALQQEFSHKCI